MHRTIKTIKQRNSRQVQNETYSRERDAASVRHCLAHNSEQRKKGEKVIYIETSGEVRNIPRVAVETEI